MIFRSSLLAALFLAATGLVMAERPSSPAPPVDAARLEAEIQTLARAAQLPAEAVAVVVAPLRPAVAGQRLVSMAAERPLQPASTIKVLTTLAGLELLGPTWRGRTRLLATGPVDNGVLRGDLVLET
jgi:D-alanyl-D-alanine carboxypeptidase/D-alanyl-D-alanine-endopeptidase (penicillin-binding protein 4)